MPTKHLDASRRSVCALIFARRSRTYFLLRRKGLEPGDPSTVEMPGGSFNDCEYPITAARQKIEGQVGLSYRDVMRVLPLKVFRDGSFECHNHLFVINSWFRAILRPPFVGFDWVPLDRLSEIASRPGANKVLANLMKDPLCFSILSNYNEWCAKW